MGRPKSQLPNEPRQGDDNISTAQQTSECQAGPAMHIMRLGSSSPATDGPNGRHASSNRGPSPIEFGVGAVALLKDIDLFVPDSPREMLLSRSLREACVPNKPRGKYSQDGSAARCCCTERLLDCADSLSAMPNDFWNALRTARESSKTIYEVLRCCSQCRAVSGSSSESPQGNPSADSVLDPSPTTVILGTVLFPLLIDVYRGIAELVEKEACAAVHGGGQIIFDLEACGGLWGPMGESSMRCQEYYSNLTMDAEAWRTTVRALLRADMHGFDIQRRNDEGCASLYHQPGLCDLISDSKDSLDRSIMGHGRQKPVEGLPAKLYSDAGLLSRAMEAAQQSLRRLALT
jgi:hypothetical protein